MRPWLLAIVGILLVANGYWASRNLVLKSADDGIVRLYLEPMLNIYVGGEYSAPDAIVWAGQGWVDAGKPIDSLEPYWEQADNPVPGRSWQRILNYRLNRDASILTAFQSLEAAFEAGAGSVVILYPTPEIDGKAQDSVPVFQPPPQYRCNGQTVC